jgi:hypothetical protein
MSKADEYRQYAADAMRWARHSTISQKSREALLDLARTWTEVAERYEHPVVVKKFSTRIESGVRGAA